jgi:hypothetical protein
MTTFTFHSDPSHGWLEVSAAELFNVGFLPSDFSAYSYQQGDVAYLEEDCDAPVFIQAYEAHIGPISVKEKFLNYSHWIRQLSRIEFLGDDELPF